MPKYFFKPEQLQGDKVILDGETAHHLLHVLRTKTGEIITLCNGEAIDYNAEVRQADAKKTRLECKIIQQSPSLSEPSIKTTLYQGLPKNDKLETIIQKCVELGVSVVIPVMTSRSVARLKNDTKKAARYQKISESAAGQSMRGIIPKIHEPLSFANAIKQFDKTALTIVAYEEEKERTLKAALSQQHKNINIWVGPEGGFSKGEVDALTDLGAIPVTLGPRILRTETAAISILAQVLCLTE
ncbi:MAG: 16S rRNA (uracil(1498)-N(3))-methyltransferase [Firmicutes bacterium]|nr:16S rRNA (uracil(1498)-N(3))-methyltransferase [Bacillota bacterium]